MNQTLIVVPTYNERENLSRMAQRLLALPVGLDLLVVDDNSPDGTGQLADELAAKHPAIHVLHGRRKTGWAAPTSPGSSGRWNAVTSLSSRWTAIFPTSPTISPRCSKLRATPSSCSGRATSMASASSTGR